MTFQPQTFEEACERFKPLKRKRATPKPRAGIKPSLTRSIARKRPLGKKTKRPKKLTDGQLKKRAWREFSIFIRTQRATLDLGLEKCITCGAVKHWKELQAGHFIRGRLNANLFDERGCHPQCYACNVGRDGNVVEYYEWMLANYGAEVIAELKQQNNHTRKWLPGELKEIWQRYKALNAVNPLVTEVK